MYQVIILKCMSMVSSKFYMLYSSVKHGLFNISDQSINSFLHLYSSLPTFSQLSSILLSVNLFARLSIRHFIPPHFTSASFPPSINMNDSPLPVCPLTHPSGQTDFYVSGMSVDTGDG